jgi:hypothetical protein
MDFGASPALQVRATFASAMTVVAQPNVVTPDEMAGVQTGELLLVTEDGVERLHSYERGLRCSSAGGAPSQVLMPAPFNSVARRRIGPVLSASQQ